MMNDYRQAAFTLVELLVIIGIIGLIFSISLAVYNQNLKSARDAERQATLNEIAKVFQTYQAVHGRLPDCRGALIIEKDGSAANFQNYPGQTNCADLASINSFFTNNYPEDIIDPRGPGDLQHVYVYDSDHLCGGSGSNRVVMLFAKMEVRANSNRETVCPGAGSTNNEGGYNTTDGVPTFPYVINLTSF